jgi:hypothetical protein
MEISSREAWTVIHGLILGTLFLLAFAGGLAGLWSLRPGLLTAAGIRERMSRLYIGMWAMALVAWATTSNLQRVGEAFDIADSGRMYIGQGSGEHDMTRMGSRSIGAVQTRV